MSNKRFAVACFILSLGLHVHLYMQGRIEPNLWLFPFVIGWGAFLLPAMGPVIVIERWCFGFAPWGEGHTALTYFWMTLFASTFWFFPAARIARWFGTFDPFTASDKPRPRILGAAVFIFEQANKRLFGRQKTGGWA